MDERGFRLHVITQEKSVVDTTAVSVVAPGSEGYLGIWKDHAPLVTALQPGRLSVKTTPDHEIDYSISGGFLEVSHNTVTILADALEMIEEIDLDRAEAALRRAEERMQELTSELDQTRAEWALKRARNRARLAKLQQR